MDDSNLYSFYRTHIENRLLPFWSKALDQENGGIYTCYTNPGDRLVRRDKYTWSQGRYLWLGAKLFEMVSRDLLEIPDSFTEDHLHKTAGFLEKHVFLKNGNCAFLLSESGEKKEPGSGSGYDTSIYADCFVAIGLAGYSRLFEDAARFERALTLYDNIRERVKKGTYRSDPYPVPNGFRPHSIPMILLNVTQELYDTAQKLNHPKSALLNGHATAFMKDIMENFCLDDFRIAEMLPDSLSEAENSLLYRHRNPGHAIESMWFVMHKARQNPETAGYIPKAVRVIEEAVNKGRDREYGGLLRFVDKDGGKPAGTRSGHPLETMIMDSWPLKLWWPHSEALYATLLAYKLTGNRSMLNLHESIREYTFATFPNPDEKTGEWIQIRDRKGNPVDKVAALPVKDPFHILRSLLLILEQTRPNQTLMKESKLKR